MDVQIPHSAHSEIQKKGHIQSVSSRLARNNPNSVQVFSKKLNTVTPKKQPPTSLANQWLFLLFINIQITNIFSLTVSVFAISCLIDIKIENNGEKHQNVENNSHVC